MRIIKSVVILILLTLLFVPFSIAGKIEAPALKDKSDKKSEIKATFVELGSVNCIPCKAMQPVMKAVEEEYGDQVKVVFYDVWTKEGSPYGEQYKIRAIPTQIFLDKDGKEFFRHMGFFPKEEIAKVLEKQGIKPVKATGKKTSSGSSLKSGEVCK